jgi:hypothetical protein
LDQGKAIGISQELPWSSSLWPTHIVCLSLILVAITVAELHEAGLQLKL